MALAGAPTTSTFHFGYFETFKLYTGLAMWQASFCIRHEAVPRAMNRKLTILDVAAKAGVSSGTVSHVINGTRDVSQARREQVLQAIRELGFVPNGLAQGLRRSRSRVVGLCVPDSASSYFAALIDTVEDIAADQGYEVMQVLSRHSSSVELGRVRALLSHRIAGLLIIPGLEPKQTFDLIADTGTPAVILDRIWNDNRFDYVTIDNRAAMREAVEALVRLDHTRLAYVVSYPGLVTTRQRIEAFHQTAQEASAAVSTKVLERGDNESAFAQRLTELLRSPAPPTAIIASNSVVTLWTMRILKSLGIQCPDEVSVLSFDEPDWADVIEPSLSIVRQPTAEVARTGWRLLMSRIVERDAPTRHVELTAKLILRGSVRPLLAGHLQLN
jgi:LacI family transcriptional regulator